MPAKISRRVGGKFTAWGTHISGLNLALLSGSKIVQAGGQHIADDLAIIRLIVDYQNALAHAVSTCRST